MTWNHRIDRNPQAQTFLNSITDPNFERRVRFLASRSGLTLPTARAVMQMKARLDRERPSGQEAFTAALTQAAEAGEPWAREALAQAERERRAQDSAEEHA